LLVAANRDAVVKDFWRMMGAVAACLLTGCQTMDVPAERVDVAILNVTVIDPQSDRVLQHHNVFISDERIVAVTPAKGRKSLAAARSIDGTGRYLIPGLVDMHAHLFLPEPATTSLNLFLANGVTAIREMSSDCWAIAGATKGCIEAYRTLQAQVRSGKTPGPEMLQLTSTMVMGPSRLKLPKGPAFAVPTDEAAGRTLAGHLVGRGIDLIKTHDSIPMSAFAGLMAEANRQRVGVVGHIPFAAGSLGAARLGYRSIEHARDLLYDCSRYGPEFRKREAAVADGVAGASRPPGIERLQRTVAEFSARDCADLLKGLAATGVYYVPTHVTREMEALADDPRYRADPARKYILRKRNADWESDLKQTAALPGEERRALRAFFEHGLKITGLAHRAGIPIMAGSDSNDTMIVPGFSLHRELELLGRAGLSPMDVLRSATSVPANYLNRESELGGISPGRRADLVLLSANPLEQIRNTRSIQAVIARGRVFDRGQLDALLVDAERVAAAKSTDKEEV
jgi:hypothetical protein